MKENKTLVKRALVIGAITIFVVLALVGTSVRLFESKPDYKDTFALEIALDKGTDTTGKTVDVTSTKLLTDGPMGFMVYDGNKTVYIVDGGAPMTAVGDKGRFKVVKATSMLGSWVIYVTNVEGK